MGDDETRPRDEEAILTEKKIRVQNCAHAVEQILKKYNCEMSPEITIANKGIQTFIRFRAKDQPNILVVPPLTRGLAKSN